MPEHLPTAGGIAVTGPPTEQLCWLQAGTELLHATVQQAGSLARPSAMPGWTGRHLVTHVARNADALGNLLAWARTGVVTPMYATPQQRAADIEAGAHRPDAKVRADLEASSSRLSAAVADMTAAAWKARVRTARGREVEAAEVVWMRIREVWMHAVDLGAGVTVAAFPDGLTSQLLAEAATDLGRRADCPAVLMEAAGSCWRLGGAGAALRVSGTPAELLTWLTGRGTGSALRSEGPVPRMPPWL
jgi:maleylpyruvate isomerase